MLVTIDNQTIARASGFRCNGICEDYILTYQAEQVFKEKVQSNSLKRVSCLAENLKPVPSGLRLWKTSEEKFQFDLGYPLAIAEIDRISEQVVEHSPKADKLLYLLSKRTGNSGPFAEVVLVDRDRIELLMTDEREVANWIEELKRREFLRVVVSGAENTWTPISGKTRVMLTPQGWNQVEHIRKGFESRSAFVAMSFSNADQSQIFNAIQSACAKCGFEAKIVSDEQFNDGITDKIIAMINESKFVIAEFTDNKRGVYYEAGYAAGMGLPVINLIRAGHHDGNGLPEEAKFDTQDTIGMKTLKTACHNEFKIHFDTQHLNYIVWNNVAELESRLADRIRATILKADRVK